MKINEVETVSVVIPTYNRVKVLAQVLPSYLVSPHVIEVIIVDDASTDKTATVVTQMQAQEPRLQYICNTHNRGAPASRNIGARAASGQWVLQSEDDLELGKNCIETLLAHAETTEADLIAGRRIWMKLGESQEQAQNRAIYTRRPLFNEWLLDHNSHAVTEDDVETPLLDGTMLIRREVFEKINYYEPYGGQSTWREESDFQIQALTAGYKLIFCPHATTFHYSRSSQSFGRNRLKGTANYAYRMYHNNLIFLRRNREYLRSHHPRSILFGIPEISALIYGVYRTTWLLIAESLRIWRARKHGAFSWE